MRHGMILILAAWLLTDCSAPEQRTHCSVTVEPHPSQPYPAGVIVVRCDGLERARIVARRAYAVD